MNQAHNCVPCSECNRCQFCHDHHLCVELAIKKAGGWSYVCNPNRDVLDAIRKLDERVNNLFGELLEKLVIRK